MNDDAQIALHVACEPAVNRGRLYRARPEGLAELRSYLDEFWETGLERLRQSAEAEQLERTRRRGRRGAA
jgi:hypothetical protein